MRRRTRGFMCVLDNFRDNLSGNNAARHPEHQHNVLRDAIAAAKTPGTPEFLDQRAGAECRQGPRPSQGNTGAKVHGGLGRPEVA